MFFQLRDSVIGHRVSLLFSQTFFQAAYDLARPAKCEGDCVPKDFSLRHASLEHKENKRASRYILCRALKEATNGHLEYYDNNSRQGSAYLGTAEPIAQLHRSHQSPVMRQSGISLLVCIAIAQVVTMTCF